MNWKVALAKMCAAAALMIAASAGAVEQGEDFLVGTWTRDGDCTEGDVVKRDGAQFRSNIQGQAYTGTVQREGNIIKTDFASADGNSRRYTYQIENDNRLRVVDFAFCDRVHCEAIHVQSFLFVMRCAE